MSQPPAAEFQAAADTARAQVDRLEPRLAEQYARTLRRAGRRAARQFRISAVLHPVMVAAGDVPTPGWTVPPVDELLDTVQITADLLANTGETRQAAAVAATRPIMSAMGVSFSLQSPIVKDLVSRTGVRATKISIPGLRDAVISAMTEAFSEGLSVPDTANLILSKTDDLAVYQSTMLARTDLIGTANGGSILAAKVVYPQGTIVKRWVNATDSNTETDGKIRDTHLEANGQTVPLDGFFTVGGDQLLYPGDPSGSDEEVINCRCTVVYDEPIRDINAAAWDESKHPRFQSGVHEGGRFAPKANSMTWEQVQAKHPLYAEKHFDSAVAELAWGGDPTWDGNVRPLAFTEGEIQPRDVVFQRYPMTDSRARGIIDKYQADVALPPVLLVDRGGELLTADGHHRLSAAEKLGISLPAVIAHSPLVDKYQGAARIGTLHDDVSAAAWDESKHPRFHSGMHEGGRFKTAAERAREAKAIRDSVELTQDERRYVPARATDSPEMEALRADFGTNPQNYFTGGEDGALDSIAKLQGFDGLPEVVSSEELNHRIAGGSTELWRGLDGPGDDADRLAQLLNTDNADLPSGAIRAEQFRSGEYHAGQGTWGNGMYTAGGESGPNVAIAYADKESLKPWLINADDSRLSSAEYASQQDSIVRMALRPEARVANGTSLRDEWAAHMRTEEKPNRGQVITKSPELALDSDLGRYAASRGYDAIDLDDGSGFFILLNRTAVAVQEAHP